MPCSVSILILWSVFMPCSLPIQSSDRIASEGVFHFGDSFGAFKVYLIFEGCLAFSQNVRGYWILEKAQPSRCCDSRSVVDLCTE